MLAGYSVNVGANVNTSIRSYFLVRGVFRFLSKLSYYFQYENNENTL